MLNPCYSAVQSTDGASPIASSPHLGQALRLPKAISFNSPIRRITCQTATSDTKGHSLIPIGFLSMFKWSALFIIFITHTHTHYISPIKTLYELSR